ncbi:GH1 family beta-glucosidase [Candidatus Leptofilum sp.]|uniref:GH1 family beta-glucosidase n=1 Tax=Candidatus Leptofilum sp. TaxID=3241576 RepID=UPI003B5C5130
MPVLQFPENFVWGVATSAYQIEGAWDEDGRSPSHWDTFAHTPGKTRNGENGDVACDHYHRWPEDIALMASLGIQAYRFSVSWPRILPTGGRKVNEAGLDYYDKLVDGLLERGIRPFITLYHWELPQTLQELGGWPAREVVDHFVALADVVSRRLGDRVKDWITHNEPWCTSMLSHQIGLHAPGWQNWLAALRAAHHVLLSHGLAMPVIRANAPQAEVGIAPNYEPAYPLTRTEADLNAARIWDGYYIRWFNDPLFGRHYPADMVAYYEAQGYLPDGLDFVQANDMATIATPVDFIGVNNYTRQIMSGEISLDQFQTAANPNPNASYTEMNWEVYPNGLYDILNRLHFDYQAPKIYITENGCSYSDGPSSGSRIADTRRIEYFQSYLAGIHKAIGNGVPVAGYFVWSFMDNFEWSLGYSQRFGIVYVDYETQQRLPKDSAFWYGDVIRQNRLEIE